jgi:hypothetical protein
MKVGVISQFEKLCSDIAGSYDPMNEASSMEVYYEKFLLFLKGNTENRENLVQALMRVMLKYRDARNSKEKLLPITAIAYSMHELRWPEILEFALRENKEFYSIKRSTLMSDVIDAYQDNWDDREFFRRYSGR